MSCRLVVSFIFMGTVLVSGIVLARAETPMRGRILTFYVWTGPHGTEHFSDRPPPVGDQAVVHTLQLPPALGRRGLRRERRRERRAERALNRYWEKRRRRVRAPSPPSLPRAVPSPPAVRSAPLWYLPFAPFPGVLPLRPRPPAPPPSGPPPELMSTTGGFGICGYEIACPSPPPPPVVGGSPPPRPPPVGAPQPPPPPVPPPPPGGD